MSSALAVEKSDNSKIGLVHATYASQQSCPLTCPLKNAGCYAEVGLVGIHTRKVNNANPTATPLDVALAEAEAITTRLSGNLNLRIHVVGDCATTEAASIVSRAALSILKKGNKAWSYTHAWADVDRKAWDGVSVLASAETPEQVQQAQGEGWATAIIVSEFKDDKLYEDNGIKILPCVNQTKGVKCVECRLCWDAPRLASKGITIGFAAHGSRRNTIGRMLKVIQ
jgi:hypothetical protein